MSRPTVFTPELGATICEKLAECGSLRRVCLEPDMPLERTVRRWYTENEQFASEYARAKEAGIDALVDETLDIADDGSNDYMQTKDGEKLDAEHVQRSKIRIETRRWLAERMMPKKYGVRTGVDLTSSDGTMTPVDDAARASRIAALLKKAGERKDLDDLV